MASCLILNIDNTPLSVVSLKRAMALNTKGAIVPMHYDEDLTISSVKEDYKAITVARIRKYVYMRLRYAPYSRKMVLKRDNYRCVYCGSDKKLTIDHVVPLSSGGKSSWENTVTSCHKCNNQKGNSPLVDFMQAKGFTHTINPYKPHHIILMIRGSLENVHPSWMPYIYLSNNPINDFNYNNGTPI
jgi:hypothetical protein